MAAAQPNHRASLLAGLRTGGVRSVSVPHTAGPTGTFHLPPSDILSNNFYQGDENINAVSEMLSQQVYIQDQRDRQGFSQPRTASVDNTASRLSQQQQELLFQRRMTSQSPNIFDPSMVKPAYQFQSQSQMQIQMMQMEVMRLQALAQMQQIAQMQIESAHANRNGGVVQPSTAGPGIQSFATSGSSPLAQLRARQMEQAQENDRRSGVPMTAALDGKFGGRSSADSFASHGVHQGFHNGYPIAAQPGTANSGAVVASKSDSAVTWRRRSVVPPVAGLDRMTPSIGEHVGVAKSASVVSPVGTYRSRPEPLCFTSSDRSVHALAVSSGEDSEGADDSSSSKSENSSSPTTPMSGMSNISSSSAREEASKKLFQGLGLGRPAIRVSAPSETPVVAAQKLVSQPYRQPRGPPGAADELGDKNFANRLRKKAIGGLGVLLEARERRDVLDGTE